MITVYLNNRPIQLDDHTSVARFLERQDLASANMAIAVNNKVVPRNVREATMLTDGDHILIITASYGG